jgi:diketogulonate reductase-like aldo/keto reductase
LENMKIDKHYPVGLGTMGFGGSFSPDSSRDKEYISSLKLAIDRKMTIIDTAEVYGGGHCEELIGQAISGCREKIFLVTKVSPENLSHENILKSCEQSLERLGTDYIDLYMVHWPNPGILIKEIMKAFETLVEQGKINHIGLSNFSVSQIKDAQAALKKEKIHAVQTEYNLFDRSIENELLPYCQQNKISLMAYSPLDQGYFNQDNQKTAILENIAKKYQATIAEIILAWLISHPWVIVIPKSSQAKHIITNSNAGKHKLNKDEQNTISSAFKTIPTKVEINRIKVALDGQGNRKAYQTLDQALANELNFTPSPACLAEDLSKRNEEIKPVKVRKTTDKTGLYYYDLIEGRIRYWAWVIAHAGKRKIPVLIRE